MSVDTLADKLWEKTGFCDVDHGGDLSYISLIHLRHLQQKTVQTRLRKSHKRALIRKRKRVLAERTLILHVRVEKKQYKHKETRIVKNEEEEMDNSSPKVEDFMGHLMKFMSAEMKWRKEDRKRERQAKNLERKRIQHEEKDLAEIQAFRRTPAALSTLPKILDNHPQCNGAVERLNGSVKQALTKQLSIGANWVDASSKTVWPCITGNVASYISIWQGGATAY